MYVLHSMLQVLNRKVHKKNASIDTKMTPSLSVVTVTCASYPMKNRGNGQIQSLNFDSLHTFAFSNSFAFRIICAYMLPSSCPLKLLSSNHSRTTSQHEKIDGIPMLESAVAKASSNNKSLCSSAKPLRKMGGDATWKINHYK